MKPIDWKLVIGLVALFAVGALMHTKVYATILSPGELMPVKAVCDSPATLKHILTSNKKDQASAVQHAMDTEACILLPVPMPMAVRMLMDTFHIEDAIIYVYEMDTPTKDRWYAFVYEAAKRT